jgi:hypothetical protein
MGVKCPQKPGKSIAHIVLLPSLSMGMTVMTFQKRTQ